jgi:hypothetical protein
VSISASKTTIEGIMPEIWATAIYSLSDEGSKLRECYGRTAEECCAMRNDFIRYSGRPDGTKKPYVPSEVTVHDVVEYPENRLELVQAVTPLVRVEQLARVLRVVLFTVGYADPADPEILSNNPGWERLCRDLRS